jgi:hypothetical protein
VPHCTAPIRAQAHHGGLDTHTSTAAEETAIIVVNALKWVQTWSPPTSADLLLSADDTRAESQGGIVRRDHGGSRSAHIAGRALLDLSRPTAVHGTGMERPPAIIGPRLCAA